MSYSEWDATKASEYWSGVVGAIRAGRVVGAIMRLERHPFAADCGAAVYCRDVAAELQDDLAAGCIGAARIADRIERAFLASA